MAEKNLKPCPFCGGKGSLRFYQDESLWSHNIVTYSEIGCRECDYSMNFCKDDEGKDAIEKWNNRIND
jgi:Lar family restriction alleviation protein